MDASGSWLKPMRKRSSWNLLTNSVSSRIRGGCCVGSLRKIYNDAKRSPLTEETSEFEYEIQRRYSASCMASWSFFFCWFVSYPEVLFAVSHSKRVLEAANHRISISQDFPWVPMTKSWLDKLPPRKTYDSTICKAGWCAQTADSQGHFRCATAAWLYASADPKKHKLIGTAVLHGNLNE